jgi:hypothetical protein
MKITVEIEVPDGETCLMESGYFCPWIMKGAGGQRWCRIFNEERIMVNKCPACRDVCKK